MKIGRASKVRPHVSHGASTGTREAKELRDGDPTRFEGRGVTKPVGNVRGEIAERLVGARFESLAELDAAARAPQRAAGRPLWGTLVVPGAGPHRPVPHFDVVNGGVARATVPVFWAPAMDPAEPKR